MIKRTLPWDRTKGNGAIETCERCSMQVIKFRDAGDDTPRYASLLGQDDKGHLLLGDPEARWLDPKKVTVIWIRDFAG